MATDAHFEVYSQHTDGIDPETQDPVRKPTGEFGWRFQSGNGKISAIGGEGFTRRADAHRAIRDFCDVIATVEHVAILDVED